ncbi:MAG: hypothetical protein CMP83_11950 [Gammaproteobacteria bacterium]|nr:hypothetical protein [Gammaproteobacteria bacterium]
MPLPAGWQQALSQCPYHNTVLRGQFADSNAPPTLSLPGVHQINAGEDTMRFSVHPDHLHEFDATTGQRVQS